MYSLFTAYNMHEREREREREFMHAFNLVVVCSLQGIIINSFGWLYNYAQYTNCLNNISAVYCASTKNNYEHLK